MTFLPPGAVRLPVLTLVIFFLSASNMSAQIRDRAVFSLNFDDLPPTAATTAADSGKAGKVADAVALTNAPSRIASAFVSGSPGYSLMLDDTRQQQISVSSSEDVSRPDAVTISGMFACLHPPTDTAYRGLFAKRRAGNGDITNYGINFQPSADHLQVYVNDGKGYKVIAYSVKEVLGYRRRVHLTVCLDHGDAPGTDEDSDADDIRVRLFVNGTAIAPTRATGGLIDGVTGWLQDISLANCVSDTPLTIGSSFAGGEAMRLICDEFHLFPEALSDEDVQTLFREVADTSVDQILSEKSGAADAALMTPQVTSAQPHAAQVGQVTRMMVQGQNLAGARLRTDIAGIVFSPADGGGPGSVHVDVSVDKSVVPGRYLVRALTDHGVSNPFVIAVDHLPLHADGVFSESNPAESLPVAVAGLISGSQQKRVWFRGTAGQRIVAEVEARRIGSRLDPVVEIRSLAGTPLSIQWQQPDLSGDARTSLVIPADGVYYAEIHDLQFKSPGNSAWRLMLGDLPPSSLAFPAVVSNTLTSIRSVGTDAVSEPVSVNASVSQLTLASGTPLLALPSLHPETGTHVVEPLEGTFDSTPLDAAFTVAPYPPLLISGRISAPKETDTIVLTVTPQQTIHIACAARQLSSPLRAQLTVFSGETPVAQNNGDSGASDPAVTYTVPEGVTQLRVQVRDINGKGSPSAIYRVLVARTDRPGFVVTTRDGGVLLPVNGSVPIRLSVTRQSPSFRYTGAIRLSIPEQSDVTIVPETIPPGEMNQEVLVTITRSARTDADSASSGQSFRIHARAEGAEPVFSTWVSVTTEGLPQQGLTLPGTSVVTAAADSIPATLVPDAIPPVLFRGLTTVMNLRMIRLTENIAQYARFEMITTEPARREDPNNPNSPLKPQVRLSEFQFGPVSQDVFPLQVVVPLDTPAPSVDAIVSAEFVDQPLGVSAGARAWTAPMVLFVEDAAGLQISPDPVILKKGAEIEISGRVIRHPLFTESVSVTLAGLPQGYTGSVADLEPNQSAFSLTVKVPDAAAAGDVPNVTLVVQSRTVPGAVISKPAAVKMTVQD